MSAALWAARAARFAVIAAEMQRPYVPDYSARVAGVMHRFRTSTCRRCGGEDHWHRPGCRTSHGHSTIRLENEVIAIVARRESRMALHALMTQLQPASRGCDSVRVVGCSTCEVQP